MLNYIKYIAAYISLILLWALFALTICSIFDLYNINVNPSIGFVGALFGYIYHENKPMEFKELIRQIK